MIMLIFSYFLCSSCTAGVRKNSNFKKQNGLLKFQKGHKASTKHYRVSFYHTLLL